MVQNGVQRQAVVLHKAWENFFTRWATISVQNDCARMNLLLNCVAGNIKGKLVMNPVTEATRGCGLTGRRLASTYLYYGHPKGHHKAALHCTENEVRPAK
jgi:hypothetical protein